MTITLVTGDHPRHKYFADRLAEITTDVTWVKEVREAFVPTPDDHLPGRLKQLFVEHFDARESCEAAYFGGAGALAESRFTRIETISQDQLTDGTLDAIITQTDPELLLSYGCHKLTDETLGKARKYRWNVHGGLSPWYRGVITHFWPTYMLEPQFTGVTLHETTKDIDGGGVILQTGAELARGDGVHDTACKAVGLFARQAPQRIMNALGREGPAIEGIRHKTDGRIWISTMWGAQHLEVVYGTFGNRVVDYCIDNNLLTRQPKLHSAI